MEFIRCFRVVPRGLEPFEAVEEDAEFGCEEVIDDGAPADLIILERPVNGNIWEEISRKEFLNPKEASYFLIELVAGKRLWEDQSSNLKK